ncbi:hypothetical protein N7462_007081 [Penicillium macrosclerotiorum]|uniref:uncharacterized protein n=1 Tax=Penicillium macrosclerotiorum TaxID=303699 RepID=UPI002546D230|nr:uncharacterized protein N7462_007081 [Penicillium macrosclerotiorum]KAJ5678837.1 hypothetical protein N7462_007081 [Penicillium macrosclerotiorum]
MSAAIDTVGGTSDQSAPPSSRSTTPQLSATGTSSEDDTGNRKENIKPQEGAGAELKIESRGHEGQETSQVVDDFGLPIRMRSPPRRLPDGSSDETDHAPEVEEAASGSANTTTPPPVNPQSKHETLQNSDSGNQPKQATGPDVETPQETAREGGEHSTDKRLEPGAPDSAASENTHGNNTEISEWSHQHLAQPRHVDEDEEEEEEEPEDWKAMPALGEMDYYDDYGRLIARGLKEEDDEAVYSGLGGAGKGYTRVQLDEDAQSATSMDEDTSYLFQETTGNSAGLVGEELRDTVSQLQATKDLLNETQKIAYVGVVRLAIFEMNQELAKVPTNRSTRKVILKAQDSMRKWGQAMMGRIYMHMEIDAAEQIMIEQLAEHGVQPGDLVRPLMQNARVKNPMAEGEPKTSTSSVSSPTVESASRSRISAETEISELGSPPPYDTHEGEEVVPEVQTPSQLPTSAKIDIDLRWTVLCDLFLVLIADSAYDARSRTLLERVGAAMDVTWLQISRFEKRVTDALEMQEQAEKETWDESEHMENRRQMSLKRKYMIMGLATVGGGLVIGLSAGLLAPVIGAGLAAGFTTVGISGTSAFLGGVGGTALIASGATMTGSAIGLKASHRRTGAVQTFEYRPLHNNKKVNLIVTVSGWMTGKVDDVRLPYSTVDPIMGDIYSVLWEPEMLRSMGDTINILATEALTQGLQQVLGSTVLMALMASLQLPLVLTKLSYLIDNPWTVSLARANAAGLVMADSLRDRNLGNRPITLLGFSLGARVIFSCLKELADKGAHGLIQNVYLFGSPIVASKDEYMKARSVVSGRFVNGYATNDWILGYLFRATSGGIMRVSGLAPIEGIPGLENFDLTQTVNGHMAYRSAMPRILREVGWEVLEDEFAEIEDPDPDDHAERQRELIREIDDARREAELKPEKKRFGLFKRGKMAEKKSWETYDVDRNSPSRDLTESSSAPGSVLFDIEAIRAELASEAIEVKQLESTLPPMKLNLNAPSDPASFQSATPVEKPSKSPETPSVPRTVSEPELSTIHHSSQGRNDPAPAAHKDEEIEMTFDTSFHKTTQFHSEPPSRPELHSSSTMPTGIGASAIGAMAMEHNAWADHDHDLGHGDGEISMTFE